MSSKSTSGSLSADELLESNSQECKSNVDSSFEYDKVTIHDRLKMCFRPKYRMRKVTNRGAVLIVVWNLLVTTVLYYVIYKIQSPEKFCPMCFRSLSVPLGLALLFAGFLADIYFKRYKVLFWSIVFMWISVVLLTATILVESILLFRNYVQLIFLVSLGICCGGFQANIVQFGIDQLTDSSTNEILSFINWYLWSFISSAIVTNFASKCSPPQNKFITPFLLCFVLSVVVSLLFLCNNVLIKEPITQNPFKLIYRVLKYARRHKRPQQRSAFTYCEDDIPSRIDFGKMKYGGPFTTEQVEDVKTFFGALGLVLIDGFIIGITYENDLKNYIFGKSISDHINTYSLRECSYAFLFTDIYYISVALLIPINELIFYPLFQRCIPSVSCYWKIALGSIFQVVRYIILVTLVTLSRQHFMKLNKSVVNSTYCIFYESSNDLDMATAIYSYKLFAIPDVLSALSYVLIATGSIKFLCAQIPYSMKGVIIGLFYGSMVVFSIVNTGIRLIFKDTYYAWSINSLFSCGFWYLQSKLVVLLIAIVVLILLAISYKKRKREDVLPNEHIFAERFYSKKLNFQSR